MKSEPPHPNETTTNNNYRTKNKFYRRFVCMNRHMDLVITL